MCNPNKRFSLVFDGVASPLSWEARDAVDTAFGFMIEDEDMTREEALYRFDQLEIGQALVDEDGDTWMRVEDAA